MLRDLTPDPEIVCKIFGTDTDEKAKNREKLLSALRFRDSRNKLDKSPLSYINL